MNLNTLLAYNEMGLIPGPGESEEAFLERASYCQTIDSILEESPAKLFASTPEIDEELKRELGFTLPWTPVLYSNKDLALWHGGCAWIFEKEGGGPKGAFFQLRKSFSKKNSVFGYTKKEIYLHEAVHVGRMAFDEPQFEEVLAYRTSKNRFRRYVGPIITKPYEALLFFISLIIPLILIPYLPRTLDLIPFLLPVILIGLGWVKLVKKQGSIGAAFKTLVYLTGSEELASHILYRLTDKEIVQYGKLPLEKLKGLIYSERTQSLRQQLLYAMAFKDTV